eukprot:GHVR01043550.1.p1 GENE.GHVR01043550.1~~GHVR01043550.1.p1  ORF type:complete len:111 (-),score=47.84 GHVR01043550.1:48-380(-)
MYVVDPMHPTHVIDYTHSSTLLDSHPIVHCLLVSYCCEAALVYPPPHILVRMNLHFENFHPVVCVCVCVVCVCVCVYVDLFDFFVCFYNQTLNLYLHLCVCVCVCVCVSM